MVVSVVHVAYKARHSGDSLVPSRRSPRDRSSPPISSTLAATTIRPSLRANEGKSFEGSNVLGMGFTFDDTDKNGVAIPIAEMQRLIAKDKRNAERIFPYIGGEEVNDSPTQSHHRLRHQLWGDDRRRGTAMAGPDGDSSRRRSSQNEQTNNREAYRAVLVAITQNSVRRC